MKIENDLTNQVADTIDNSDIKSDIKAKIALHIIGMNGNDRCFRNCYNQKNRLCWY